MKLPTFINDKLHNIFMATWIPDIIFRFCGTRIFLHDHMNKMLTWREVFTWRKFSSCTIQLVRHSKLLLLKGWRSTKLLYYYLLLKSTYISTFFKKPCGSETASTFFGMSCESIEIKKNIALSNVLMFRMSGESIDIKRSIAPSNVPWWTPQKKGRATDTVQSINNQLLKFINIVE